MSEKLNLSHHQNPDSQPLPPIEFGPETGALNWQSTHERVSEVIGVGKVAYHGIRTAVAQKRMERAGARMERMEHKDAMYEDIGFSYASGSRSELGNRDVTETANPGDWQFPDGIDNPQTATSRGAKPRSIMERLKIQRVESKRHKLDVKRNHRKYYEDAFHIRETQNPAFRDANRRALEVMPSTPVDRSSAKARRLNKVRQLGVRTSYLKGNLNPEEQRKRLNLAKANRTPQESRGQKRQRKGEERAIGRLVTAADQPITGAWRQWRRSKAVKDIQRHHARAEKHRQLQEEVRS